jgi:membrane protein YdbS with pleckstrin-like domain
VTSDRGWLSLDGETVAWDGGPKRTTALPGVLVGVALVAAAGWLGLVNRPVLGAVVALAGVAVAGWSYLAVVNTEYVVTDRAVYERRGILGVRVTEAPLSRVQNSALSQGVAGSLLGYGTVTLEVAGGNDVAFRRIDDPAAVRPLVDRASDQIPGSIEQWRAVLAEVRALRRAVERRQ